MNASTAARLIEINRHFYERFGASFSATRRRIQPGVRRVMQLLKGDESILDLGCGNGEFARELAKRGHQGPYLGVDFSLPLLHDAQAPPRGFSASFVQADLTQLSATNTQSSEVLEPVLKTERWTLMTAFAVLHHIPSDEIRLSLLRAIRRLLAENGTLVLSNWQFLNSEKLKHRIQPWDAVAMQASDVDAGDYLLDWRSGGNGLRYIHHFSESELTTLAATSGFLVKDQFYSDGESGKLALYQIWTGFNDSAPNNEGHNP